MVREAPTRKGGGTADSSQNFAAYLRFKATCLSSLPSCLSYSNRAPQFTCRTPPPTLSFSHSHSNPTITMKTAFAAASTVAMANSAMGFVTPNAVRAVAPSTAARSSSLSMEFAGGLRGADGPEPNSKNFDPLGLSEARPENLLFFREAEIKVCVWRVARGYIITCVVC